MGAGVCGTGVIGAAVVDTSIGAYAVHLHSNGIIKIRLIYSGLGTGCVAEKTRKIVTALEALAITVCKHRHLSRGEQNLIYL